MEENTATPHLGRSPRFNTPSNTVASGSPPTPPLQSTSPGSQNARFQPRGFQDFPIPFGHEQPQPSEQASPPLNLEDNWLKANLPGLARPSVANPPTLGAEHPHTIFDQKAAAQAQPVPDWIDNPLPAPPTGLDPSTIGIALSPEIPSAIKVTPPSQASPFSTNPSSQSRTPQAQSAKSPAITGTAGTPNPIQHTPTFSTINSDSRVGTFNTVDSGASITALTNTSSQSSMGSGPGTSSQAPPVGLGLGLGAVPEASRSQQQLQSSLAGEPVVNPELKSAWDDWEDGPTPADKPRGWRSRAEGALGRLGRRKG